ncbi:MAG: carcinine hydrolase/isopenicillin-N N-acyltransferase family protein [Polyangiaceae bacterium]
MCDSFVVRASGGQTWFAKNSDREPGESQAVEHLEPRRSRARRLAVTHIEIDDVPLTREVSISRPTWMWGAEMGVNDAGLAVGNEAIFTRIAPAASGLTGMDLVRLALERASSADEALDLVTSLLARYGQGGRAGYRDRAFRYDNAFFFVDRERAWLLETAGPYWVAAPVTSARWASNAVSIGVEHTRVGPGTEDYARLRGWLRRGERLDFRRAFGARAMSVLSGGDTRRRDAEPCLARLLRPGGKLSAPAFVEGASEIAARLRRHPPGGPRRGARIVATCAHASWLPTRRAGQTTGTMIARLGPGAPEVAFTGTSAPCLSVLKRVPLGGTRVDTGPPPRADGYDPESLFWRHERLHRATLRDYDARRDTFEADRAALEARALAPSSPSRASELWQEHRAAVLTWLARATSRPPARSARPFDAYWSMMSRMDGIAR